MHEEILSPEQVRLLPLLGEFADDFGLIGGTAIALQIGHRRSIDFDLVTFSELQTDKIRNKIRKNHRIDSTLVDETDELTLAVDGLKFTFLRYPFLVPLTRNLRAKIKMPDLLPLAAMKAFTISRRAKWKDYVDLYFVFKQYNLKELSSTAKKLFGEEFNEKLFREQLAFFKDIDYSEKIAFIAGYETDDGTIKDRLTEVSLQR